MLTSLNMHKDELLTLHKQSIEKDTENLKIALIRKEKNDFIT